MGAIGGAPYLICHTRDMMTAVTRAFELAWLYRALGDGHAKRSRRQAKLSQSDIAAEIGVSPSAVASWESGRRQPRGLPAIRYAELLMKLNSLTGEPNSCREVPTPRRRATGVRR